MAKKKRTKKYRSQDTGSSGPTVHRYVAETEESAAKRKAFKRKIIGYGIILLMLVGLVQLIF